MTNKTFFVHAGGSKTGTSALQNFLEIHAGQLEQHDFAYVNRLNIQSHYEITSGNGILLTQLLKSASIAPNELDCLVLSYFGSCHNAICSSEQFADLDARGWQELLAATIRLGIKLQVIFYVRNVIPFLISLYDQALKRHGCWQEFDDIVSEMDWQPIAALQAMVAGVSAANMHVLHYDSHHHHLIRNFLDNLGIDNSFKVDASEQARIVNRSLTHQEREHLKIINKIFDETYCTEVSDLLIYADPYAKTEKISYNQATVDQLLHRYQKDVDWVNHTFFGGQNVVSVLPARLLADQPHPLPITATEASNGHVNVAIDKLLFNWAIEKLKSNQNAIERHLSTLGKLNDALKSPLLNQPQPGLPDDFNPLVYLLLNPDVLIANVDPVAHYIDHGRQEGRQYRFNDKYYPSGSA